MKWSASFLILALGACSNDQPAPGVQNQSSVTVPIENAVVPNSEPPAPKPAASGNVSQFTSDGLENCRVIDKNEKEGPYYRHLCPGVGGYKYEVVEHDLRQSLVFIAPDGRRSEVELNGLAGGGGFSVLGPTFDWRGPAGRPPRTVTVRFNVDDDAEPNSRDTSYLVVIKLAPPSCPVGIVPPSGRQNEKARSIADGKDLKCSA